MQAVTERTTGGSSVGAMTAARNAVNAAEAVATFDAAAPDDAPEVIAVSEGDLIQAIEDAQPRLTALWDECCAVDARGDDETAEFEAWHAEHKRVGDLGHRLLFLPPADPASMVNRIDAYVLSCGELAVTDLNHDDARDGLLAAYVAIKDWADRDGASPEWDAARDAYLAAVERSRIAQSALEAAEAELEQRHPWPEALRLPGPGRRHYLSVQAIEQAVHSPWGDDPKLTPDEAAEKLAIFRPHEVARAEFSKAIGLPELRVEEDAALRAVNDAVATLISTPAETPEALAFKAQVFSQEWTGERAALSFAEQVVQDARRMGRIPAPLPAGCAVADLSGEMLDALSTFEEHDVKDTKALPPKDALAYSRAAHDLSAIPSAALRMTPASKGGVAFQLVAAMGQLHAAQHAVSDDADKAANLIRSAVANAIRVLDLPITPLVAKFFMGDALGDDEAQPEGDQ